MDAKLQGGLTLAYVGDAFYELEVRKHFVEQGLTKVDDLHKTVVKYTCAEHQSKVIKYFVDNNILTDEEITIYKRGRNSNTNKTRKTLSLADYNNATGLESLIGYLHLTNNDDRAKELIKISISLL